MDYFFLGRPVYIACFLQLILLVIYLADAPSSGEEFHEEFNPPPEGSYTGLQKVEKVQSVVDLSNDKEQAQVRYALTFCFYPIIRDTTNVLYLQFYNQSSFFLMLFFLFFLRKIVQKYI